MSLNYTQHGLDYMKKQGYFIFNGNNIDDITFFKKTELMCLVALDNSIEFTVRIVLDVNSNYVTLSVVPFSSSSKDNSLAMGSTSGTSSFSCSGNKNLLQTTIGEDNCKFIKLLLDRFLLNNRMTGCYKSFYDNL
jgi:hypothetical protein